MKLSAVFILLLFLIFRNAILNDSGILGLADNGKLRRSRRRDRQQADQYGNQQNTHLDIPFPIVSIGVLCGQ